MKLQDFGVLQTRYQSMRMTERAKAVLADAEPALELADKILTSLAAHAGAGAAFDGLRANAALTGRMRASEAKTVLADPKNDFLETARNKLAAWRKTLERIATGEGVMNDARGEYIQASAPVGVAVAGLSSTGGYLSVVQLALAELAKADAKNAARHTLDVGRIRRCATLLSDCENASGIIAAVK